MIKKIVIISICIILILLIGYGFYYFYTNKTPQKFSLVNSNPVNYSNNINVDSEISFEFSKTLSRKESTNIIETIPSVYMVKEIKDNTIIFKPYTNLKENTQYTFKLSNIQSIDGEVINPITLIFSTGKDNSLRTAFIKTLPYQGDGFYLEYDNTINTFIVTIQKNPYDKYKQDAIDYLNSKNINTNSEKIQYKQLRYLQGSGAPPG